jgi:hypothetical protein
MPQRPMHQYSRVEASREESSGTGEFAAVTFSTSFDTIPVIVLTQQENTGPITKLYVASASKTGFTIGTTTPTSDMYCHWVAIG